MKNRSPLLAAAVAGVFTAGALAGWSAPSVLHAATAGSQTAPSAAAPATTTSAAPPAANQSAIIPLGMAPNYHAIVQENRGAVVGITVSGDMKVSGQSPFGGFGGPPFGNGGDDNGN